MSKYGRNDPCPCGSGRKYKHCHLGKPDDQWAHQAAPLPAPPDLPGGVIASDVQSPPALIPSLAHGSALIDDADLFDEPAELTPLDEAWDIVDDAWNEHDPTRRAKLARQALKLSEECAGAYFLLGQSERAMKARINHFDRAIAIARRMLEPATLEGLGAGTWEEPEVEYAMHAQLHRGMALIASGRNDDATAQLDEMLAIDPTDRLHARGQLVLLFMTQGDDDEAVALMNDYRDLSPEPVTAFALPIAMFRTHGDTAFARRALAEAIMSYPDLSGLLAHGAANSAADEVDSGGEFVVALPSFAPPQAEGDDQVRVVDAGADLMPDDDVEMEIDPIADVPQLYATFALANQWWSADGAVEWLNGIFDAGPAVRYDTGYLGDGPALLMTSGKEQDYRHCPECKRPTKPHSIDLLLLFDPRQFVNVQLNGRHCASCNIISVDVSDLIAKLVKRDPNLYGLDFLPVGLIADEDRRTQPPGSAGDETWLIAHMRPFRRVDDDDSKRETWPTAEDQQREIEEMLRESGLANLLGPIADSPSDMSRSPFG